jgi:hypothetical protein
VLVADSDRAQVYAAEFAAFEGTGYEAVVDLDRLVALAGRLFDAPWWPSGVVTVRSARSDAVSSTTRWVPGADPVIRLARPQLTMATLAHELAHVLAGRQHGHDAVFRRAHVDISRTLLGSEPGEWLADAYRLHGLTLGPRRWPEPPVRASSGPIAL